MYLFKTSGATYGSVIRNQKHAFKNRPKSWHRGEIVLVSKNKTDLGLGEKQIAYTMRVGDITPCTDQDIERYWPGNPGRRNYIVGCYGTEAIQNPFNLEEVLGGEVGKYSAVMTFKRLEPGHEELVLSYLMTADSNMPDEILDGDRYREGATNQITVNAYERNPSARRKCIENFGYSCQVCGFNFEEQYGELGRGFILVHHHIPLSEIGEEYVVDPIEDMIPLCANCHAMVHRRKPVLTVKELQELFQ